MLTWQGEAISLMIGEKQQCLPGEVEAISLTIG
jgi:hypothetical protein